VFGLGVHALTTVSASPAMGSMTGHSTRQTQNAACSLPNSASLSAQVTLQSARK
jgi:hypothetical protein